MRLCGGICSRTVIIGSGKGLCCLTMGKVSMSHQSLDKPYLEDIAENSLTEDEKKAPVCQESSLQLKALTRRQAARFDNLCQDTRCFR